MNKTIKKFMLFSSLFLAFQSTSVLAGGNNKVRINQVYELATGEVIDRATSRLRVSDEGVCVTTRSRDLAPGAYTSWWTIYNNPAACTQPLDFGNGLCGLFETRDLATEGTAMFASAFIVGPNGKAHVNECIGVGELTHFVFRGNGLGDPFTAEVHHTFRYHGPAAYGDSILLGEQLNEFQGGCNTDTQSGVDCFDPQHAVHGVPSKGSKGSKGSRR